ncbi:erythrocyte membrane protein 1, PfEMP1, putative [Plasmodium reichenowi]|uniref:Erythrocyte membrane protein 1, PfEMP1, putative n=1 Tax=Plasmodium reichenowi TaxID=5854 RepID=A0A2P9D4N4_PLARE|nr:erythrocyte membrane protein 1, PfEMP1, putative [Plasmodium reichenowi]
MGSQTSKSSEPIVDTNESHKSARNVLENIGRNIKEKATKNAKKKGISLKGNLGNAQFYHDFFQIKNYIPENPCDLDFKFHSNIWNGLKEYRHPCAGRNEKNFSNLNGSVCTNSKIEGNDNNVGGACAPYRRRELCDYIFHQVKPVHIKNSHDLLGNLLVTAKYEGESIVKNHPNKTSSDLCTTLARSFADIGDIIRGKDLYIGNGDYKVKLSSNLREIFKNIYDALDDTVKETYKDDHNYYKLREDWWNVNRDQVWNAITCKAPDQANYFVYKSDKFRKFSSDRCGHHNNDGPLTNLDYVPQFLRWFEEWAEDFCRIRNHKLKNIKEACRDEQKGKYCSHNGYDCTKTIRNENILFDDPKCTGCLVKCNPYEIWLENQRNEFEKQKKKYVNEIKTYESNTGISNSNINREYNKEFYKELKDNIYGNVNEFIKLLNEGTYCKEKLKEEEDIDFNNTGDKDTFYRSDYCQVCPYCGVEYINGKYKIKPNKDGNCGKNVNYAPPEGVKRTAINIIHRDDEQGDITRKLKDFCSNPTKPHEKNYKKWECYYKSSQDNKCQMTSLSQTDKKHRDVMSFHKFFDLWVKNLLRDSIKWETELKDCINNTNITDYNDGCNIQCVCLDKWVKQKEEEWKSVKKVFENKNGISDNYYKKLNDLFDSFFFPVMFELNQDEAKWNKLMENLKKKIESSKGKEGTKDSEAAMKVLFDHLKETATICKDNNTNEGCDFSKTSTQNPCGKNTKDGSDKVISVKQIAQYYKRKAHKQLNERGGRSNLKGDASKGNYKRGGSPDGFKQLCSIDARHSNADRQSQKPCGGKATDRFDIGKNWTNVKEKEKTSYSDVVLPQRREHFCTSNLERLDTNNTGLKGNKAMHSLLGDVLLSANKQAEWIITKYKEKKGKNSLNGLTDDQTVCRAVRYSFADLGDIIRGKDMWDKNSGEEKTQNALKMVFGEIKKELKEKYKNDTSTHTQLRADWWEANRDQVWKAMKCPKNGITCGSSDHTPLDDYIPQRLRWMTEWAEWYCKAEKEEYEKLVKGCSSCKVDGKGEKCYNNSAECAKCKNACDDYGKNIKPWAEQWKKIKDKYQILYSKARVDIAANGGPNTSTALQNYEDKSVVEFLYDLYVQNGGEVGNPAVARITVDTTSTDNTTPTVYSTAEGYVHQEATMNCEKQTQFCKNKNGSTSSGGTEDTNYAFRDKPHDHDEACGCGNRKTQPEKKEEEKKDACTIAKNLVKDNNGKTPINGCGSKTEGRYPGWDCEKNYTNEENKGICVPPRRRKLCTSDLTQDRSLTKKEDILTKFINCASKETYFAWERYKDDNKEAEEQLKSGTIPENFKRQMYYTFGDYRDIFFGTDISTYNYISGVSSNVINLLKKGNVTKSDDNRKPDNELLDDWWKKHGKDIWKGMLCALTNGVTDAEKRAKIKNDYSYENLNKPPNGTFSIEEFSSRPQFLRWFTEWSDEFCKQKKKELASLQGACEKCNVSNSGTTVTCETNSQGCTKCRDECTKYQAWLKDWKEKYNKQSEKFRKAKADNKYEGTPAKEDVEKASSARDYLNKALIKFCPDRTCSCMKDSSKQRKTKSPDGNTDIPASLDEEPEEVQGKCSCTPPPDACTIVKYIFEKKPENEKYFNEACSQKYGTKYPGWKCNSSASKTGIKKDEDGGAVCIPPRRQKLYIKPIETLDKMSPLGLRQAFIECAAIETFFSWHEYKKEKEREKKEEYEKKNGLVYKPTGPNEQDEQLKNGDIPDEFLRQMFYTFGDYRDICLGKDISGGENIKTVEEKINKVFPNSGIRGEKKTPTEEQREQWWNLNAKAIWDGMVCALTYDTDTKNIIQSEYKKLMGNTKNKNKYDYETVTFSSGGPSSGANLSEFVTVPQFFRWFQEWAEDFCRKKIITIDKIKVDCRGDEERNEKKYCDDDGFDCIKIRPNKDKIFEDFNCPSCANSCKPYEKWINIKKNEFNKQKGKSIMEIKNFESNNYDKKIAQAFAKNYNSIDSFLEKLKEEPCSNNNNEDGKIDFKKPEITFRHSKLCAPCPVFGVNCNRGHCSDATEEKCKGKTLIGADDIQTNNDSIKEVNILVSDNSHNGFPNELKHVCNGTVIFKGIRENKWLCGFLCESDVCVLKNIQAGIDDKQNILFRTLFKRWVQNFLEDYNKIKEKISQGINNGKESICINGCKKNCECVDKWINIKKNEWETLRNRYFKQYKMGNSQIYYDVRRFFEKLQPQTEVQKVKGNYNTLYDLEKSSGCIITTNSEKEERKQKDLVECLLNELKNVIESWKNQTNDGIPPNCDSPPSHSDENPTLDEDIYPDDQTIDIPKPVVCPTVVQPTLPIPQGPPDACDIVKQLLEGKDGNNDVGGCKRKENYEPWKCDEKGSLIKIEEKGACMPPRRQKMCIHDLENLTIENEKKLKDFFINDSAKEIFLLWKYYKETHNYINNSILEKGTIPEEFFNIMKYTYSDYKDLFFGTDISNSTGINKVRNKINSLFVKTTETDVRKKWWDTNGPSIWKGMLCVLPHSENFKEKSEYKTPPEDFAKKPQFLRWFVEWGDEYCYKRRELEKNVKHSCKEINAGYKDTYCRSSCAEVCKEYNEYVTKKKEEYNTQKDKFNSEKIRTSLSDGYKGYSNIEASEYLKKKCFFRTCDCMDKVKNNNYWEKPFENFENAALKNMCEGNPQVPPRKVTENKDPESSADGPCDIVKELLEGKNQTSAIDNCNLQSGEFKWECDPRKIKSGEEGACIPPRRQMLCVHFLQQLNNPTEQSLRDAFIKCASAQTFLSWHKFKTDNNGGTVAQSQLESGEIPEDFLRQMFYTFGDYRDLCLGKDIGNYVNSVNEKITAVFKKIDPKLADDKPPEGKSPGGINRKTWWDEYAPAIWQGMLCGLSYASDNQDAVKNILTQYYRYKTVTFSDDSSAPTLSKFAQRPQFLRWFTEWAEHFCREHKTQLDKLMGSCKECTVTDNGTSNKTCEKKDECDACKRQCQEYQKWLKTWKENYKEQKKKFLKDKKNGTYKKDAAATDANSATNAREYLDKQLKNMTCTNGNSEPCNYNCMENASKQQKELPNGSNDMPESLDDEPEGVKGKCKCVPDECNALSVNDSGFPDAGVFGGGIYNGKCKGFEEHLPKKFEPPQYDPTNDILKSTIPVGIALALGSIAFLFMKKKPKSPVDLLRVLDIHKGEYGMPTKLSSNRYIPYKSAQYKGKRYIYIEGDSSGDEKYAFMSDTTDITSSESEYEEFDINDIYVPRSPKYKTLIEVVLEPSKRETQGYMPGDARSNNPITEEEWNTLKDDFISNMLQNKQNIESNDYRSGNSPKNTNNTTTSHDNVDNNTYPTPSHDTLDQKPFIMSIHDRNLLNGEKYNYDMINNIGYNDLYSDNSGPTNDNRDSYSGTDLINDALSGNQPIDIYDKVLKRKENELFGTNYKKNTSNNSVAKPTNTDPVMNQLDLLHKWLDRHRHMCEKWSNKEELLDKLKEKWDNDNNSGDTTPSNNKMLNTDVSIEIDMDNPKPINQFSNMDTNVDTPTMDNMEDYVYYDVNDDDDNNNQLSVDDIPMDHNKVDVDVPKKVHVEMKILNNISKSSLEQQFPISDVWNI